MTKKEHLNRLKYIQDHLKLINLYRSHFTEKLGEKGVEKLIDTLLDEMIFRTNIIKKLEDENK